MNHVFAARHDTLSVDIPKNVQRVRTTLVTKPVGNSNCRVWHVPSDTAISKPNYSYTLYLLRDRSTMNSTVPLSTHATNIRLLVAQLDKINSATIQR
jgi:hypothetical protein